MNRVRTTLPRIFVVLIFGSTTFHVALAQRPPAPVVVAKIIEREVASGQVFVATVQPTRTAVIGSAASGRVAETFCEDGDRVKTMQPLAQLLTETISSEIDAAKAELELRQSMLEELENGTRPEEIEQAKAQLQAAEARRAYTKDRRQRAEDLFRQEGALSLNDRDEAVTLHLEAESEYLTSKAAYELATLGPRKEKISQAKAQVAMQAAILKKLVDQKRKHTIITRFDGFVIREHSEVGAWLSTGDLVFEVAALDEVDIEAFVTEQQVPHIKRKMEIGVEIPALGGQVFTGKVHQIVPMADMKTRTFPIRVRVKNTIDNDVPLLKAGMVARVHLPTGTARRAMLVPKDALVLGGQQRVIYVVDIDSADSKKMTVRPVPVQVGVASGRLIQVSGALQPEQMVVIEGNERLRPGQPVVVAEVRSK